MHQRCFPGPDIQPSWTNCWFFMELSWDINFKTTIFQYIPWSWWDLKIFWSVEIQHFSWWQFKKWFPFAEVLEEVQREMVNYKGCGMSVMEMSHRSKEFMAIAAEAEKNLRDIFGVPSNEATAGIPSGKLTWLLKMAIYSGFSHEKWWFPIVMLVYQRVIDVETIISHPFGNGKHTTFKNGDFGDGLLYIYIIVLPTLDRIILITIVRAIILWLGTFFPVV